MDTTPTSTPAPAAAPPADAAPAAATPPIAGDAPSALQSAGAAEPSKEPAKEPAKVELKAPKGFEPHFEALSKHAQELGLEGEKAQKFIDSIAAVDGARAKQLDEALAAQDAKWAAELKADPEIGGPKFDAAIKDASRALARFGGKPAEGQKVAPLAALLHQAGLGNHPLVLKAFAAIGRAMADDTIAGTSKAAPAAGERKSDAELFYGTPTAAAKEQ